jgi:hypothetical protein
MAKEAELLKQFAIEKRVVRIICRPLYPSIKSIFDEQGSSSLSDRINRELESLSESLVTQKDRMEQTIQEQTEFVNRRWESDKLSLVPGDLLLDRICQHFGVRYSKVRDGSPLASFVSPDDVPWEIESFLRGIGGPS